MDNTGMTFEAARFLTKKDGVSAMTRQIGDVRITDIRLSAKAAATLGKREGRYITLRGEPDAPGMTGLLRRALLQLIPPRGRLFAAGLGNPDVTQDSLGAVSVRAAHSRKGALYSLAAIETDVAARTGLDAARLVKAAARELHADCVIVIDSLSCQQPEYIGKTVQLTDAGIIPGSGVGADRTELSESTLRCPIAAIGVPTLTALPELTRSRSDECFQISRTDIDTVIKMWGEVIGGALDSIVGFTPDFHKKTT